VEFIVFFVTFTEFILSSVRNIKRKQINLFIFWYPKFKPSRAPAHSAKGCISKEICSHGIFVQLCYVLMHWLFLASLIHYCAGPEQCGFPLPYNCSGIV